MRTTNLIHVLALFLLILVPLSAWAETGNAPTSIKIQSTNIAEGRPNQVGRMAPEPSEPFNDIPVEGSPSDLEGYQSNKLKVEWFGLLLGLGHPIILSRIMMFKLLWESAYWTIVDCSVAVEMGVGMAAGWRKKVLSSYEVRLGLGIRWEIWFVDAAPWIKYFNHKKKVQEGESEELTPYESLIQPVEPTRSDDTWDGAYEHISGAVFEPQFAFLSRGDFAFIGLHVGFPIIVGMVKDYQGRYNKRPPHWSPGFQLGLYLSFY